MIALALLLQSTEPPIWSETSSVGVSSTIFASEVSRANGRVTAWVHEYGDPGLGVGSYTIAKYVFDCHGTAVIMAATTYRPDGEITGSWDGAKVEAVRPGSVLASAEAFLCHP